MAEKFSLNDHLFNPRSVGQLASEYAAGVPGFDVSKFEANALAGFADRGLLERLDWIATCIGAQLSPEFEAMADQLEAAMPAGLDPELRDDDFGQFIHAVPGILAVRHGLEDHRDRALDLIHAGTQRFSMEFYIRPFLNRWPEETLARLALWARDDNYHVRRLVSEGTRPKLPWAKAVKLVPDQALPLLDMLHADKTRYVTRSVANHLNDLSKTVPEQVLERLAAWGKQEGQNPKEMAWMTRHALRTLIKQGQSGAMTALGYRHDVEVTAKLQLAVETVQIGDVLAFDCILTTRSAAPLLIDYRIEFARAEGKTAQKVFKLKVAKTQAGVPLTVKKTHRMKGDATTFRLYPGAHRVIVQVNGRDVAEAGCVLA